MSATPPWLSVFGVELALFLCYSAETTAPQVRYCIRTDSDRLNRIFAAIGHTECG
jgi:hypothetical protein